MVELNVRRAHNILVAAILAGSLGAPQGALAQTAGADGKAVFARCAGCHSLQPGVNGIGPSLAGIVGRKSAAAPKFSYSPALKGAGLTWDAPTLDRFLTKPAEMAPGTRMAFIGLPKADDRAALIAYLRKP